MNAAKVENLKKMLRTGKWNDAQVLLNQEIEAVVQYLSKNDLIASQTIHEFNEILYIMQQAIEYQDVVLLCDIIEYEMEPFIDTYITKTRG
ncbi:hypothetical protein [Thermotalea metallivorans]|uniref:Uncharacterized protein n=1 Tax=Thermotalea metallivorans TaxID=520762 RepID=A0A140L715_9FIRM|nr:hypothetical protein [Thermotalea metallivorans]KXG76340.1 hypothetical protein AN619_12980 [Thermotalea metallivorans]